MNAPFALYQITQGLSALLDRIDDPDNPISLEELTDTIGKLEADKTTRFQELRNAIINEEAKQDAIKAEIDRLDQMKKSAERMVETLKSAALGLLKLSGDQRIDFPTGGHIRWQNNSAPTITVEGPVDKLPPGWFEEKVVTTYAVDRKAVLDAQAIGAEIPKAITVTLGQHIRIK